MTDTKNPPPHINRRQLLKYGAALGCVPATMSCAGSASALTGKLDLSTPENRLRTHVKLIGSLANEDVYISMQGELWGVLPGRPPEPICGFQGIARANWRPQKDGSYSQRSFDLGFFSDLETGEPLTQTPNPFTGEIVHPFHYKYGGNDTRYTLSDHETANNGKWTGLANHVWYSEISKGEFASPFPVKDWPRESSGDIYYASSEITYQTTINQLVSDNIQRANYTFFWTAFLSWEPWLLMDGAPGFVMWRGVGTKLQSNLEVPQRIRDYVMGTQPNYFDDAPPWEGRASTYASFKKERKPHYPGSEK